MSAVMCDCGLMDLWLRTHSQQCTAMLIVAGSCYSSAPATVITGTLAAVLGHVGRRWTSRTLCQRRATVSCSPHTLTFSFHFSVISQVYTKLLGLLQGIGEEEMWNIQQLSLCKHLLPGINLPRWIIKSFLQFAFPLHLKVLENACKSGW